MPQPTIKDTALVKLPFWIYAATIGKVLPSSAKSADNLDEQAKEDETVTATVAPTATEELADDSSHDAAQRTASTDSDEDFGLLDKSVDDLATSTASAAKPKATGSKARGGGKAKKRNNKKR